MPVSITFNHPLRKRVSVIISSKSTAYFDNPRASVARFPSPFIEIFLHQPGNALINLNTIQLSATLDLI